MGLESLRRKRMVIGTFFLLPSFILLSTLYFYPVVNSIIMSFTNWTGFNNNYTFVGFRNYKKILFDMPQFWKAMVVNLKFAVGTTIIQAVIGFMLAFTVYNMGKRSQSFFKITLFLPVILPVTVVGVLWSFILTPDFGLLNQFLRTVGLGFLAKGWLADYSTALPIVIITNVWRYMGFTMVLYFIAMLNISSEILEAARIDGASKFKQLLYIFIPLTRGTTEINFILSIIGGMKAFDLIYIMTGGGPGTATQVVGYLIYNTAFTSFQFSRALAMSLVLFIFIFILTSISRKLLAEKEE